MMAICVLMEVTCLYGLLFPSNLANERGLKFSGTGVSHISLRDIGALHLVRGIKLLLEQLDAKFIILQSLVLVI